MKTLFRCVSCYHYSLHEQKCIKCGEEMKHPYPARFSLVKEKKFRKLYKKQ
ncbi:MAG: ribosome biogenesis protein [Candidatus Heimdallarchaeota archaeon]|nr:ribosome biogenesis protein [Candidatus Heimdallarchaeota archaeon]